MKINRNLFINHLPWLILLLLGILVYLTHDINISSDMTNYLNYGLNLSNGRGYTEVDGLPVLFRGPLFSWLIALSFWLLGPSPWSGFWVVRVFCILNPLMLYFLGKRIWNTRTGVVAALLALTSYSINHWSYRHLDAVWPFFVFLAIYLLFAGLESGKAGYFAGTGLALGLAFLVKEVVILFLPVPLLVVLLTPDYRKRENFNKLWSTYGLLVLCILPWLTYQVVQGGFSASFGISAPVMAKFMLSGGGGAEPSLLSLVQKYAVGFFQFFYGQGNALTWNFLLAPVMAASWLILLVKAVKGERGAMLPVITAAVFLPMIVLMGMRQLRLGQGLIFYHLSYLAAAYALWWFSESVYRLLERRVKRGIPGWLTGKRLFALLAVMAIAAQITLGTGGIPRGAVFFKRSRAAQLLIVGHIQLRITGAMNSDYQEAAEWMQHNIPAGSTWMVSKPSEGEGLYFYGNGDFPMLQMPVYASNMLTGPVDIRQDDRFVFLSSWRAQLDPKNKIYFMTERELLRTVLEKNVRCIIVAQRRNYLSLYFDASPSFEKAAQFGEGRLKIYKVIKPLKPIEFPTLVSTNLKNYLRRLKTRREVVFQRLEKGLFYEILKKDAAFVNAILEGEKIPGLYFVNNSRVYGTE